MKKKILSLVLAATIGLSTFIPNIALVDTKELDVTRISGKDRYDTSVEASKKTFPNGSKYVIVASGEDFPDALVGGTLASQIEAPILLVSKNLIPNTVTNEIKRLKPSKIYILGGIGTISKKVEDYINILGTTERLAGKDRFETADEISSACFRHSGSPTPGDTFAVMNAYNFADSLSAAPFVGQSTKNHETHYVITGLFPYSEPTFPHIIFGGTDSVPKQASEGYEGTGIRYAGSDRYGTAVEVAKAYKTYLGLDIDTIVLVDGTRFPDALASAPVASTNNGAILLTHPTNFSKATKDYINNNDNIKNVIIVGGENSVSANIERELRGEVTPPVVEENNFDKLDKGLQAYIITSITGDWRLEELKELPDSMIFSYYYEGNTLYTQIHSGAGTAHPIYHFVVNENSATYKDGISRSEVDKYYNLDIPTKTASKDSLYLEYLSNKNEYDKAYSNNKITLSDHLMQTYKENKRYYKAQLIIGTNENGSPKRKSFCGYDRDNVVMEWKNISVN